MAKKKKTIRRRKRSHSGGGAVRRVSRRRPRRKGMLGDLASPTMVANAAKETVGTLVGISAGIAANKILATQSKPAKVGIALAVCFGTHMWGMSSAGSGFAGAVLGQTFANGFLNDDDDTNFADEDALQDDSPVYLSDEGYPMVLQDDGSMRYLSDEETAILQEEGAFADYEEVY